MATAQTGKAFRLPSAHSLHQVLTSKGIAYLLVISIAFVTGQVLLTYISINVTLGLGIFLGALALIIAFRNPYLSLLIILAVTVLIVDRPNDLDMILQGERYPYNPYTYHIPILHFTLLEVLFLLTGAGMLFKADITHLRRVIHDRFSVTLLVFLTVCLMGVAYSAIFGTPVARMPPWERAVREFRPFSLMFIAYFVVRGLVDSRERMTQLLWILCALLMFKGLEGVYRFIFGVGVPLGDLHRIYLGEEILFFMFASVVLISVVLHSPRIGLQHIFLLGGVGLFIFGLLFSLVRAICLGTVVGVGATAILCFRKLNKRVLLSLASCGLFIMGTGAGILYYSGYPAAAEVRSFFSPIEWGYSFSLEYRLYEAKNILQSWWEAPILGHGFGGGWKDYYLYLTHNAWHVSSPHNLYLSVLLHLGLFGLGAFVYLLYRFYRELSRLYQQTSGPLGGVVGGLRGAFLGFLVVLLFGPWLTMYRGAVWIGTLFGLVLAMRQMADQGDLHLGHHKG